MLWPWVLKTIQKYDSIELLSANFGHALANHVPKDLWEWEVVKGVKGQVPIRFFSEYSHPKFDFPEEFFFVTQGHYSLHSQKRRDYLNGNSKYPPAVKHNGKIAILVKEPLFGLFLESFKRFQINPLSKGFILALVD